MKIDDFVQVYFRQAKHTENGYKAKCPCHDDRVESLAIGSGNDGRILLHCFGCRATAKEIVTAVGGKESDLFPVNDRKLNKRELEAVYVYPDGKVRKRKWRYSDGSKSFDWQHIESGKWISGRGGPAQLYYHREDVEATPKLILLVEGEKDVDTLHGLGIPAASTSDGAGVTNPWKESYSDIFRDKDVIIVPDNDITGHEFAERMAENIKPVASILRVIDLVQLWPDMPNKADVTDYIHHIGDLEKSWDSIVGLMLDTPDWKKRKVTHSKTRSCDWDSVFADAV